MKVLTSVVTGMVLATGLVYSTGAVAEQQRVDEQLQVPADVFVKVENMRGEVSIKGTADSVARVEGVLDEYATGFIFALDGSTLTIAVEMPQRGNFSGNDVTELEIWLPQSAELTLEGVSSDYAITGFNSDVRINTVSGDITAKELQGDIRLNTVSGDVFASEVGGRVQLKSVSGDIDDRNGNATVADYSTTSGDIRVATPATEVRVESVSGDIELTLSEVKELAAKSVSGDVEATFSLANNGRVTANSVSGDVELAIRGELNAKLSAVVSGGGSIVNRLNEQRAEESRWGVGAQLKSTVGNGSGVIDVTTMSGDIHFIKK
ncbi:DUF4097 family beta strand repeat-containing protein [Pseudidiomarina insulisalsae]|uniref:DUF4097 domain-containing protein n=1 Tax=Pseudidiomarina insulisalsae TaxID=575789 RepID=A0A432YHU1_9GAMM|nr:DUF4097 family beta strand repeat-containing protein [Pseudidiomarina insulisalsae]RUO60529.1 hypothetical protein CWI71_06585 [Pseudidiomarina insulisalsae]